MTQTRVYGLSKCMSKSKTINILEWCVQINNHTELKCNNTGPSFVVYAKKIYRIKLSEHDFRQLLCSKLINFILRLTIRCAI